MENIRATWHIEPQESPKPTEHKHIIRIILLENQIPLGTEPNEENLFTIAIKEYLKNKQHCDILADLEAAFQNTKKNNSNEYLAGPTLQLISTINTLFRDKMYQENFLHDLQVNDSPINAIVGVYINHLKLSPETSFLDYFLKYSDFEAKKRLVTKLVINE